MDAVDYSRFAELDLPVLPKGVKPTGSLTRSLKRLLLVRRDVEEAAEAVLHEAARFHFEHAMLHITHSIEGGAEPNCEEHHQEMDRFKKAHSAAKRDARHITRAFNGIAGFEFSLEGNGTIEVFMGGEFVFTPTKEHADSGGVKIEGLDGVPPEIAEIVSQVAKDLGATKVTVERVGAGSNSPHADILELIKQFDQVTGSRNGGRGSDNGRPQPSHFAQQAAAAERNGQ